MAHLPPEAGNINFKPMMRCYVRRDENQPYIEIMPVGDDPVPCGFSWHNTHLDAVVESTTRPSWQANIALLVP